MAHHFKSAVTSENLPPLQIFLFLFSLEYVYILINYLQENHQVIWSTYNIQHFTNTITNYTRHHHPNHFMHLSSHTKLLSAIFFPRAIVKWNNLSFSVIKSVKILIFIGQLNSTCVQFFWGHYSPPECISMPST